MIESSCHCGAVKLEILVAPDEVTDYLPALWRLVGLLRSRARAHYCDRGRNGRLSVGRQIH